MKGFITVGSSDGVMDFDVSRLDVLINFIEAEKRYGYHVYLTYFDVDNVEYRETTASLQPELHVLNGNLSLKFDSQIISKDSHDKITHLFKSLYNI